jgi:hypothetical protein
MRLMGWASIKHAQPVIDDRRKEGRKEGRG